MVDKFISKKVQLGYQKVTDLNVWQKARVLRNSIQTLCKTLPAEEKYKLVDQIVRSSRSVTANISEGHGRFHFQENIQFCRIARGSLIETLDHLTVALDCKYLSDEGFKTFEADIYEIEKMLNGYIKYLKTRKIES